MSVRFEQAFEQEVCETLVNRRDAEELGRLFERVVPAMPISFHFLPDCPISYGFTWHCRDANRPQIGFGHDFGFREKETTIHRLLQIFPLLMRVASHAFDGQLVFRLGDETPAEHIGFCSNDATAVLIPDCDFQGSLSYQLARDIFAQQTPWEKRSVVPYWRGSSTGKRIDTESVLTLPRARLCKLSQKVGFDCLITSVVQSQEQEKALLVKAGLVGDAEDWTHLSKNRYNIDIDGNSSSWSGLFLKLLSGGVVLKVESPYKQWFYHLLEPWNNFVPIASDLSDLQEKVDILKTNQDLAKIISHNGRKLALSLTYESQMILAENAIIRHAYRTGIDPEGG